MISTIQVWTWKNEVLKADDVNEHDDEAKKPPEGR